jgi:hypothetical protein
MRNIQATLTTLSPDALRRMIRACRTIKARVSRTDTRYSVACKAERAASRELETRVSCPDCLDTAILCARCTPFRANVCA